MSLALSPAGISPAASLTLARSIPNKVEELQSMGPFELFQTQMAEGNTEAQVDAMKRLPVVAYAMGAVGTMKDLVPYLQHLTQQSQLEDELLLLLAKQMQTFVPSLLSKPEQILELLPIVERLAAVEETVVREQSVVCFNHLVQHLPKATDSSNPTTQTLVAMAKRLVSADWFTAKVSVAGMLPALHRWTQHSEISYLYKELCLDETPMVRRAASSNLGALLQSLTESSSQSPSSQELIPVLQQLCQDEQDSVRMLAVAALAKCGPAFGKETEFTKVTFLPILKEGSTDMSWRVRHNLAKHFSDAAINMGFQKQASKYISEMSLVMACFVSLLADVEAEVRAAAVGHFASMVHWGGSQLFQTHLLPLLPALADDVVMEVRSKCALAIMESSEGGTLEDPLIVNSFGPLLESFLQDEFQEVQLQVLGNLHKLSHLLNGMNGVVSSILNMSKATNWRVRQGVAKLLPHLAEARGLDFFLTVLLDPAWLVLLLDPVACVRQACCEGMSTLTKVAGSEWIAQYILPQHIQIYNQAQSSGGSYLVRITILQAHTQTALVAQDPLWMDVVKELMRGVQDRVPNVRMVAAYGLEKVLKESVEINTSFVTSQLLPALTEKWQEDDDVDSREALQHAIEVASKK